MQRKYLWAKYTKIRGDFLRSVLEAAITGGQRCKIIFGSFGKTEADMST